MIQILDRQDKPSRFEHILGGTKQAMGSIADLVGAYKRGQYAKKVGGALSQRTGRPEMMDLVRGDPGRASDYAQFLVQDAIKESAASQMEQNLIAQGVDPETAQIYSKATTGGKTQVLKDFLELKKRGLIGEGGVARDPFGARMPSQAKEQQVGVSPFEDMSPEEESEFARLPEETRDAIMAASGGQMGMQPQPAEDSQNLDAMLSQLKDEDKGLTPSERVKRQNERYKTGTKAYSDITTKLRSNTTDKQRLKILDTLNASDRLPSNMARINVDAEGNLRLPFASTPEAQRYVKTLNEFSSGAKDTFGSRVTNFDLAQYLKRFPTLLNSKEGRKQLIQQMRTFNDINSTYYKNLKSVYDKAGGVRHIDADIAEGIADRITEPQVEKLIEKFDQIGAISSLPSAAEFKGRKIQDEKTGEVLISNGTDWVPQGA